MLPKYRFKISINDVETVVNPLGWGNAKRVIEREAEEVFYRAKINEKFIFTRDDRDLILAEDIETRFVFIIERSDDGGTTYTEYWRGFFNYTDCEFYDDPGDEMVKVQVSPIDAYENILAGIDKEFNLIELAPETTQVTFVKQPVFQVYILNSNYLSYYIDGFYGEQPVSSPVGITPTNDIETVYFFSALASTSYTALIPGDNTLNPDVSGLYDYNTDIRQDGHYQYLFNGTSNRIEIIDLFDSNNVVYQGPIGQSFTTFALGLQTPVLTSTVDGISECKVFELPVYARTLCNIDTIGVTPTVDIPNPDIVPDNFNYSKVLGQDDIGFILWYGNQDDPTPFGKFSDSAANFAGKYHTKPDSATYGQVYPIARTDWTEFSIWFYFNATLKTIQESASQEILIKDAYKLPDVLSALLSAIDPNITHQETSDYSAFFYGTGNSIRGLKKWPIIVPKSNVVVGEYDKPAQKAPIKLSEVFEMLYRVYKCKCYINSDNELIIEHIDYFENGGIYGASLVGTDLTTLLEPKTGLNWEYGANKYTYNKFNIPERIEFAWMDDVGKAFEGSPIVMRSAFAEPGNVERWEVTQFTSDIDFIQIQPGDIAKQGFVLLECLDKGGGLYYVPFVDVSLPDGIDYKIQNGYAAFAWLAPNYHKHRMPAPLVTINEEDTTATTVQRNRKQVIRYGKITEPDVMKLIGTGIGFGKVQVLTEDMNAGTFDIEIQHDND